MDVWNCSICGQESTGWGNNPAPVKDMEDDGPCCDVCNGIMVLPERLIKIIKHKENK